MAKRLRVGVIYGGRSGEHEISLRSAIAVIRALHSDRYEVVPIAVTKRGRWFAGPHSLERLDRAQRKLKSISAHGNEVVVLPEPSRHGLVHLEAGSLRAQRLDVVFPVLHGSYGEDGTIQGLLELAGLPYVGAGVLGSAVGMDKDVMKRLLRDAGLPIVRFITLRGPLVTDALNAVDRVAETGLGYPCFVKPANLGSSVGVSKVSRAEGLPRALRDAARYDTKIVIEEAVVGREFEIAVLGNIDSSTGTIVSVPGEVIPGRAFYDYIDKYVGDRASTMVPAAIPRDCQREMAALAQRTYEVLECDGMARVDFFLDRNGEKILVNEINTIPGFTPISLFPRMWEASGMPFPKVVDRLITLALDRHARRAKLTTSFTPDGGAPAQGTPAAAHSRPRGRTGGAGSASRRRSGKGSHRR
jgi:D-alanine-D-alanine ligase